MATLVIKNLPDELHTRLKAQAQKNHRSLTKEAVTLLESGLTRDSAKRPLPDPIRLKSGHRITIEEIEAAIADGQE